MVKLRNKKQLIFPLIIVLAVTVLILMNAKEFVIDGVTDWRSIFKCLGLYVLMCGVLAFKIELFNLKIVLFSFKKQQQVYFFGN